MPTINRTTQVSDRLWDADLKHQPDYRYKVAGSPAWFLETQLKSLEEMPEYLADAGPGPNDDWEYDGDTGRTYVPERGWMEL
ncbi:MAG: hypothetical protein JO235_07870 [Chroococcidiopsidaceae cyanobacterium CP_BM_RX_35]|nr:hypothetical protein [Chroococcidiopsidaceae cyanobacterium CP_BM_RX_35]